MEKAIESVTDAFYYCFAVLCLACIYGCAIFLACLEVARIIKPASSPPHAGRLVSHTQAQMEHEIQPSP